ncbi:hypothetical protein RB195_019399 [Necator americanus]|uniref:Apple domain-containing protein n=1 Tax=Necator americanus TaxID=51031 RepID=A0ABR1CHI9_NECAM
MWTLVLLLHLVANQLVAVRSAPVNLPQTITCPDNNIYVYVNESAHDRTPYIFVELHSDDLQDCIHKCFGNQFCYSLKYESTAVEPCSLYYFAAYNCSRQQLVEANSVQYHGGAITIDCLRCPKNGDFVTAPTFEGFTDQTIVALDSSGHPIISKPLIKEVTNNIESKLAHAPGAAPPAATPPESKDPLRKPTGGEAASAPKTPQQPAESRKAVEERVCSGGLKFLSTTSVDLETVELLLNETTVASGNECAQLCYDLKCGFAYYKPLDKLCRFTSNTDDVVDGSTCDVSGRHYTNKVSEEDPVQLTCVSCESPTAESTNSPKKAQESQPHIEFSEDTSSNHQSRPSPSITSTLYPACIINFQLDEEADTLSFNHYEVKKVRSVNDCARICFRGRCSAAVYSPLKGECRLGSDRKETCTNAQSTIRYPKEKDVKIQCFRCSSPKHFANELEHSDESVTTPEISHQEDQQRINEEQGQQDQTTPSPLSSAETTSNVVELSTLVPTTAAAESSSTLGSQATTLVRKHCLIKFQARPFSERPPEFTAPFEIELPVDSVELCATRCYQDGCSGAKYDPKAGTCALSYNDKRFCAKEDVVLHYKAEEVTWLHCVNCYSVKISSDVPSTTTSTETSVTTTPSRSTSFGTDVAAVEHKTTTSVSNGEEGFSTIPNSVPTSAPSKDFQRGCLIKFQALPIAERPAHLTAPFELDLNVDSIELCATRCYQDGCTGAKYDPDSKTCSLSYNDKQYCTNAKVNLHYDAKNITWLHCVNCYSLKESDKTELAEQHEAAVTHVPSDDSTSLTTTTAQSTTKTVELSLATDGTTPDIGEPVQVQGNRTRPETASHFQRGCAIKFQARPFSQRPAQFHAEFEIELHVDSVELCATRCYQDGCSGAKFDPKTMSCALSYNDKHFCTTAEVVLHYEAKELTWIHCVNCYSLKSRAEQESKAEKKPENIDLTTTEPSSSTEAQRDKDSSTPALLNETTISQKEIDALLEKGCVVNFQIVELEERPPHFTSTFERSFTAETAEICAFRCYQDGCTGAKFQPDSNSCSLSYHDKAFCSNSNLVTVARPHQPVFMHCLSCVPHKSATEEGRTDNGFLSENVDETTKKEDFEEAKLQVTSEPASSTMTTSPEGTVTEPGGREVITTGKLEESTTSSQKEASGEEPQESNKVPNVQASVDEGASTVPAAGPSETPTTTTSSGEPSATSSTVTTPTGSEGTSASTSETGTSVTEAGGTTSSQEEASGEEPQESNKVPNVQASVDEGASTVPAAGPSATPTTAASSGEPSATSSTVTSPTGSEGTSASTSETGTSVTEAGGTTSSQEEASGEEPQESNKVPNVQASVDEGASTVPAAGSSATPTTAASSGEPSAKSSTVASPTGSEGTTASPTATPTASQLVLKKRPSISGTGTSVTEAGGTTSSQEEASGEEPQESNKVPNVQASVDEGASTVPAAGSSETPTTAASSGEPSASSTVASPTGSKERLPASHQRRHQQQPPTGAEETTAKEASGEEPQESNKVPNVQASVDEGASTVPAAGPSATPTTAASSGAAQFQPNPTSSSSGEPSATHNSLSNWLLKKRPVSSTSVTEAGGTTSSQEEASGEEPQESNKVPNVQASVDEGASTVPAAGSSETPTTAASSGEPSATSSTVASPTGSEGTTASTSGTGTSVTEAGGTTSSQEEASGEEPQESNKVPNVQASVDEGASTVPAAGSSETPTTAASSGTSVTEAGGTTSSQEEASGEEPQESNKVPNVQASVDEGASTVPAAGSSETPTTAASSGTTASTSGTGTSVTEAGGTTSSQEEASGEEPQESNKVPNVQASVDEGASTVPAAGSSETPTTAASSGEPSATSSTVTSPTGSEGTTAILLRAQDHASQLVLKTTASTSGTGTSVTEAGGTTSSQEEASGEEPQESNKVPNVQASVDEGASTVPAAGSSETPTTAASSGTTASTSGTGTSVTEAGGTTSSQEEASGEEPQESNKVPNVQASVDEGASTVPAAGSSETPTTAASSGEPSATSSTVTSPTGAEETTASTSGTGTSVTEAGGTTSSQEEASGEEPQESNKVPNVQASVDEGASTVPAAGSSETPTTAASSGEPSATSSTVTSPTGSEGTTASTSGTGTSVTEAGGTTSSQEEASGEEPQESNKVPNVQASVDEGASTVPAAGSSETPTTAASSGEPSATSSTVTSPTGSEGTTASTSGTGTSVTEAGGTTSSQEEASGEEPQESNKHHRKPQTTAASSGEPSATSSTVTSPTGSEGTTASTSGTGTSVTEAGGTTSSQEEASGEEPQESNKVPNVQASVDEGASTVPAAGSSETPTTAASSGEPSATSSTVTSPTGSEGTTASTSGTGTSVTEAGGTTSSQEEASGEEPQESNKVPNVQASVDEGASTVPAAGSSETPTTAASSGEPSATSSTVTSPTGSEGTTASTSGTGTSVTEAGGTTSSQEEASEKNHKKQKCLMHATANIQQEEASGEEPQETIKCLMCKQVKMREQAQFQLQDHRKPQQQQRVLVNHQHTSTVTNALLQLVLKKRLPVLLGQAPPSLRLVAQHPAKRRQAEKNHKKAIKCLMCKQETTASTSGTGTSVTEAGGTTSSQEEASGEEPQESNKVPNVQASVDEGASTVPAAGSSETPTTAASSGEPSATSSTVTSPTGSEGTTASTSGTGTSVTEAGGTTSSQEEASGEEPQESNKVPNVQASVDEGASTVPAAGSSETPTTAASSGEPSATSSTVASPTGSEGTTTSAGEPSATSPTAASPTGAEETTASTSGTGTSVTEAGGTTSSQEEASGEEPQESNKVPNVQASVDEGASTVPAAGSSETPTTAASSGEPSATSSTVTSPIGSEEEASGEEPQESNKVPNVQASVDEGASTVPAAGPSETPTTAASSGEPSATSPTVTSQLHEGTTTSASEPSATSPAAASPTGAEETTASTSGTGTSVTEAGGTTSSQEEASGEEPHESNKVPNVQASEDEGASTVPAAGSSETPTTAASSVLLGRASPTYTVTEAGGTTSSQEEASGEEPQESNKVPNVQASVDEGASTLPAAGSSETPTTAASSGEPSATSSTVTSPIGSEGTTASTSGTGTSVTEAGGTTSSQEEASGEEPQESNKVPNVQASVDEGASTLPAAGPSETPTTAASSGEPSATSSTVTSSTGSEGTTTSASEPSAMSPAAASPTGAEETTASTSGTGTSVTEAGGTTSSQEEASGEEPHESNKVPNVQASVDEGASTLPAAGSSETPTTAASSGEPSATSSTVTSPIGSEEEASGEEPQESNKVPNVQASVDEGASTLPAAGPSETPTTAASSGEPSATSSTVTSSTGSEGTTTSASEPSATSPAAASPTGAEETTASTSGTGTSVTEAGGTTSSQEEASGEEPHESNKVPNVQASVDEGASTLPAPGSSETPTTAANSGEPSATSSTVTSPTGSEGTTTSASEPSATSPAAASPTGAEETTASTSQHGSFVTEVDGDEVTTVGIPEQATTSSGVEASGEEPMEINKIPNVQASVDEGATTELAADSSETPTTAASNDEPSPTSSSSTSPTGPKGTTSSAPGDSEPSETPPTAPSPIGNEGTTTNTSQHGSFVTEVDGDGITTVEKPHEATTSSEIDSSGEESIKGNKVPNVQTSVNEEATTEPTAGSSPATETITSTAGPYGSSTRIGGADSTSPSSFARPLDSSSIQDTTPKTTTDEEDSIINPTLLERPHKISLPINVGFVPGSDPDIAHESGEDDEEEAGKTDSPKQLDYEDEVTVKTVELASVTTTAAGGRSSTTEPPVQAVKDLIEALASGGLDAVLGQPRHQSEVLENASRKLGELKKYLHKPVERKQDCSSRHVRFVPGELTDLTTKFDADATVYSLQHCARICYEIGCTFAAFTRYPRPVCLMRYGNATASECDANVRSTTFWRFSGIQQVVKLECIKCDLKSEFISQKEKIDITNLNGFSTDDLNTVVPAHEGVTTRCDGRLEFQTLPVGSLPPLNITNDVGARTPADCAKKCFETGGCSTAGFLASPSGNISNGVCLLTSDANVCGNSADYVPQHAALNPFVISCIKCSPCTYNIRTVTPDRVLPDFSYVTSVSSVGECAQACYDRRCTMAQYNSQQHSCTMTSEPMESKCSREVAVVTEGVLPVTLECVSCSS